MHEDIADRVIFRLSCASVRHTGAFLDSARPVRVSCLGCVIRPRPRTIQRFDSIHAMIWSVPSQFKSGACPHAPADFITQEVVSADTRPTWTHRAPPGGMTAGNEPERTPELRS